MFFYLQVDVFTIYGIYAVSKYRYSFREGLSSSVDNYLFIVTVCVGFSAIQLLILSYCYTQNKLAFSVRVTNWNHTSVNNIIYLDSEQLMVGAK